MPLKILHIYKAFFPETTGGVEHSIYNMCKGMQKYGIESKILCVAKKDIGRTTFDGIEVFKYPYDISIAACPFSSKLLFAFRRESKWADIIHFHYPWPFGDLLSIIAPKSKKQIVTYHSDIVKQKILKVLYHPLEQYFLSQIDQIIVTSPNYIKASNNLRKFKHKVSMLPLSINKSNYPNPELKRASEIQKKFGKNFILFIGQLRYYKGLHLLIEAIKGLNTNLVIIGKGKEELKLKKLCKELNIQNVFFLGKLSEQEKVNYLYSCYCLTLPSHLKSEAFGISLLEGSIFAKPLLSCKIGTGSEYINSHMNTGLVVEPTAHEIRKALIYLLSNKEIAQQMGINAKKRANSLFTSDTINYKLSLTYRNLLVTT